MFKRNKAWMIGLSVIGVCLSAMTFLTLNQNSVYFFTPKEALEKASQLDSKSIRIGGMVQADSVTWQADLLTLNFILTDLDTVHIAVTHHGPPPDMFKEGSGVVIEGQLSGDGLNFQARHLFVKHSEEYKVPKDKHYLDQEALKQSILKAQ